MSAESLFSAQFETFDVSTSGAWDPAEPGDGAGPASQDDFSPPAGYEGVSLHGVTGGVGPPLLLLHGYPQSHVMWHRVADQLARHFTVVAPDLRGYGDSDKPPGKADHSNYSKRHMAFDLRCLMSRLGHQQFNVVGHDRGGRVAHRLAVDHAEQVLRLAVLDIAPTREMYRHTSDDFARAYWHWFFLIQPAPFPENMILSDPEAFWLHKCGQGYGGLDSFADGAQSAYLRAFCNPAAIHAMCEDYRAAATIDIEHDDADGDYRLGCPVQVLWGKRGVIESCFDPLALWRERATHVEGQSLDTGHYLAEEDPEGTARALLRFLLA